MGKELKEITQGRGFYGYIYGRFLGGFLFEDYALLPPLCILNVLSNDIPYNVVYYNNTIEHELYLKTPSYE